MDGSRVGQNRAQVKNEDLPLLLAQRVACIRNNEKSIQDFLYYLIFNNRFVDYVKQVQTGTSIPHISLKQIGNYEVNLPSIETQTKISQILRTLDNKIEINKRINDNLTSTTSRLAA
jgi:type I restriction enzyme S subunit